MAETFTRGIIQCSVPQGPPELHHFVISQQAVAEPGPGELAITTLMVSVDPYLVMPIRNGAFTDGRVRSRVIARVDASRAEGFSAGDLVLGFSRWQLRDCVEASTMRRIDPTLPLSAYLGIAGHSGFTAMIGMAQLDPKPGQTLVVSSAGGMVGLIACQLARQSGARVVAIAGGAKAEKVATLLELDGYADHRSEDFVQQLARACPDGIDRHFENVGASILDPVLGLANERARVALCGLVQHYSDNAPIALEHFRRILVKSISILPFSIYHHESDYPQALVQLEQWVASGQLSAPETFHFGLEALPGALLSMLAGDGIGKHLVRLDQ